jgi:hypothetical protein
MKKIILILNYALCIFILSCQQNNITPTTNTNSNTTQNNYLKIKLGNDSIKGTGYFGFNNLFDDYNNFNRSNKEIKGINTDSNPLKAIIIRFDSTNTKLVYFSFGTPGFGYDYCCQPHSGCQGTNVNLTIIQNDNTPGGIIAGNFSGTVKPKLTSLNSCGNPISLSGSFKLKIKN